MLVPSRLYNNVMFTMHINIRSSWNFATMFLYLKSNEMNGLDLAIIGGQLIPAFKFFGPVF